MCTIDLIASICKWLSTDKVSSSRFCDRVHKTCIRSIRKAILEFQKQASSRNIRQLSKQLGASSMIRTIVLVLFFYLNAIRCATIPTKIEPALLVVSYDAFRPEYLNRSVTPNLNKFIEEGTSASFMLNVFPTKTFVNHFTIGTVSNEFPSSSVSCMLISFVWIFIMQYVHIVLQGLYADAHGVMANEVYDSKLGKLEYSYDLFHYSENIVPIWVVFKTDCHCLSHYHNFKWINPNILSDGECEGWQIFWLHDVAR